MDEAKTSLSERLKTANNVLVTVSRNPSVDQLSALLGLGLFLNKEGKHCAAVFSGEIPSTLEFLKPETTIQKTTDSLRDFIIALDKSKADKLRYKVEDNIVRIFITPYRSSIGQDDLEFSQGDFNVDVVVALGVSEQTELDESITAHGRILHDATVASINVGNNSNLGSISWNDPSASSLSELVTDLIESLNPKSIDQQIATALLTGIVATTDRFSNDKTSAKTMSTSSLLMAAGANQQLVATQLEEPDQTPHKDDGGEPSAESEDEATKADLGTLDINHESPEVADNDQPIENIELPEPEEQIEVDQEESSPEITLPEGLSGGPKLVTEPPTMGGTLTANSTQNDFEPTTDPLSLPKTEEPAALLDHKNDTTERAPFKPLDNLSLPPDMPIPEPSDLPQLTPPPPSWSAPSPPEDNGAGTPGSDLAQVHIDEHGQFTPIGDNSTLTQLEESVDSPHIKDAGAARAAVSEAFNGGPDNSLPTPSPSLNASPLGPELHPQDNQTPPPVPPPFNPAV